MSHRADPPDQRLPPRGQHLALQALVTAFAADKAIVDESATRTAVAEFTAE
jgi:hypothetical protein